MEAYTLRDGLSSEVRETFSLYPPLLQELLHHRGITGVQEAEAFLNPDYERHLHDPFLLKDMDKAIARVIAALEGGEHIVVYSDYDMDGGPGGVILHDCFKKIGYQQFENYIPHRHDEGYGLNVSAVEQFAKRGARLVITVDCGITDAESVTRASELGMDVIITDHHLPNGALPSAHAIVNPKQSDDSYPFDGLCGAGVAFKLVQALLQKLPGSSYKVPAIPKGWEKWLLDMAGLATIADMVPLVGENRALAYFGLTVLRKSPRPGLQQLCRKIRVDQRALTEDDVGFMIGPRINAASRMGEAMDAFHLLATDDPTLGGELAERLDRINSERKGVVASMAKEIKQRIKNMHEVREVIVMGNPRWRPSLLGLAANSLVEEYGRPVFLWGREGTDVIKGSCRSDGSVDVVALMSRTQETFIAYGGHKFSGGFSVAHEDVHVLEERLVSAYRAVKDEAHRKMPLCVDKELSLEDVSWQTYALVEKLAPFGEGNPKPLFLFRNVAIADVRHFGRDNNHLSLTFAREGGTPVTAVRFFARAEQFDRVLAPGRKVDLVANMEKSLFRNYPELRLRIIDIV